MAYYICSCDQSQQRISKSPPEEGVLKKIYLNVKYENLIKEDSLVLIQNDTIVFIRQDEEDYAIIIRDAKDIFDIENDHLIVLADREYDLEYYEVLKTSELKYYINIYCISKNKWSDAPPKIIINGE
jgi:hypothetical protein